MSRHVAAALACILALVVIVLWLWLAPERRAGTPDARPSGAAGSSELPPAPAPSRSASLSVRVSSGGVPVSGASVVVERDRAQPLPPLGSALTGQDGVATISGLPFGSWQLLVVHSELAKHRGAVELVAERVVIEVSLERGVRIEGSVVDGRRRAVDDATVRVLSASSNVEYAKQQTDASGAFVITGLDPADFRLYVHTGRHRPRWEGPLRFSRHGESRRVAIQLEDGRTLSGKVIDAHGEPVTGAHVGAADEGSALTTTDAQGRFELAGLADAPVNVYATAPGYGPSHLGGALPGGKPIEILLERAASVTGELRLQAPAQSVMVSVCRPDPKMAGGGLCIARQRYEPPTPRFMLENLPVGTHDLVIEAQGHRTARVSVSLSPGQNFTVPLVALVAAPDAH
jgi:hypothetical protein